MEDKKSLFTNPTFKKIKRKILGLKFTDGILFKTILYILLVIIGFVYLYPIIYMISTSLKDLDDLINPSIVFIPSKIYFGNYVDVFNVLKYFKTLWESLSITLVPALMQTIVASIIGYGFARFRFPGKKILFGLVILTYVLPPQVTMISRYVLFKNLGFIGKAWSIIIPATMGQGLNSAIFIIIFFQFFRMIPKVLDEAAQIDGAGQFYIFFRIAIPLSIPSFITSFLFSFVWYWNETYLSQMYMDQEGPMTLQLRLARFTMEYQAEHGTGTIANEGVRMAAIFLILLPMLIIYLFLQRQFIEGVDRAGITGE